MNLISLMYRTNHQTLNIYFQEKIPGHFLYIHDDIFKISEFSRTFLGLKRDFSISRISRAHGNHV